MFWIFLACSNGKSTDSGAELSLSELLDEQQVRLGIVRESSALFGGVSAEGQVGDYKIYNNKVQFIIQSDRESSYYYASGGGVLDADLVRPEAQLGRDVIDEHTVMGGLARVMKPTKFEILSSGQDGKAVLRVEGEGQPFSILEGALENYSFVADADVKFIVEYALEPNSSLLEITTTLEWYDDETFIPLANIFLLGKEALDSWAPAGGLNEKGDLSWLGVVAKDNSVSLAMLSSSSPFVENPIQEIIESATPSLVTFTETVNLNAGDSHSYVQWLGVGSDLSTLTDEWYQREGQETTNVSGVITDSVGATVAGARVQLFDQNSPLTLAITDEAGSWSALVPKSSEIHTLASGRLSGILYDVPRCAGWYGPYSDPMQAEASLSSFVNEYECPPAAEGYGVSELDGSVLSAPAALTVRITDGGPGVIKLNALSELSDGVHQMERPHGSTMIAYVRDGEMTLPVEPGRYQLLVHRGPMAERFVTEVELRPGEPAEVVAEISEVQLPPGVFSVDPHTHSAPSGDGRVTMLGRIMSHNAHGVDIHVSTEHDHIIDFQPLIDQLDLSIHTIVGSEVSSAVRGHLNAYPLIPDTAALNNGAPVWWDRVRPTTELFSIIRDTFETPGIIQANHPVGSGGLFGAADYLTDTGTIMSPDKWCSDFQVMELLNDGRFENELPYYFDLVSRGHPVAPVGVSDSHGAENGTGVNRTYVYSGSAASADVSQALLAGQTVVSLGPYIHASISGDWAPGKTYVGAQLLVADIFAPSWVDVNRWTLYENGQVIESGDLTGEFLQLDLTPSEDAFYNLSVAGDTTMGDAYKETPWAMTSAIKIDLNGDGWTPPKAPLSE